MISKAKNFCLSASVSTTGRFFLQLLYVSAAMLFILTSSGLIFGWSSLLLVFQAEGVFSDLCTTNSTETSTAMSFVSYVSRAHYSSLATEAPSAAFEICDAQSLRFDLVYLLGLLALFLCSPIHGWILDRFGSRTLTIIASALLATGTLILAFGFRTLLLIPGMICMASGGMGMMLALLPFSCIIPAYTSIVLAFYNVGFDSSPIVYYIFVKLYQGTGISPRNFFLGYLAIPILACIMAVFWPQGVGDPPDDAVSEVSDPNGLELTTAGEHEAHSDNVTVDLDAVTTNNTSEVAAANEEKTITSDEITSELGPVDLFPLPFKLQVQTMESVWLGVFHINCSFWLATYMGSVQARLKGMEDDVVKVDSYTETFGLILSLAFLTAPFIGYAIHKLKILKSLFVCITLGVVWNFAQFLPFKAQIATFIMFAIVRAWYYAIIFNMLTQLFGWRNVGMLWGVFNATAGIFTFGFYGVSWAVVHYLNGSYFIPSIFSTIFFAANFLFAFYLKRRKDNYESKLADTNSLPNGSDIQA